jgi:hypothetical protein
MILYIYTHDMILYIYLHIHIRQAPPFQQSIFYKLFTYKLYYTMCYQPWAIVYKIPAMSLMSSKTKKNLIKQGSIYSSWSDQRLAPAFALACHARVLLFSAAHLLAPVSVALTCLKEYKNIHYKKKDKASEFCIHKAGWFTWFSLG